jgi:hypothetical protein
MNSLYKRAFLDDGPVDSPLMAQQNLSKSPFIEGLKTGLKAAVVAAPVTSAYALLSGSKSPLLAGGLGGLGAAALFGLIGAGKQTAENRIRESELRWYLKNVRDRHPYDFLPPPQQFASAVYQVQGRSPNVY